MPDGKERQPVTPDVIDRTVILEELDLDRSGTRAAIVRRSTAGLEYRRELWLVPLDRGRPRRLTQGAHGDHLPRFSPDGELLAFLSKRPLPEEPARSPSRGSRPTRPEGAPPAGGGERKDQIWILPLAGGEPWPLTREEHGVDGFAWSPDGSRICLWGSRGPARSLVGAHDGDRPPTARRITRGDWRFDGIGHLDYRTHAAVIDVRPGARARTATEGDFDVRSPAWDADGRSIVFCAARQDDADLYPRPRVYRVAVEVRRSSSAEPVEVARLAGVVETVTPSPDGRWLALVGSDVDGAPDDDPVGLFICPADGSAKPIALAPGLDLPFGAWCDTDLHGWSSDSRPGPFWTNDDTALVGLVTRRGRVDPWRFPYRAATGRPHGSAVPIAEGDAACWQLAVAGGRTVALGTLGQRAMELLEARDGRYRTVTTMGSRWQRRLRAPEVRPLEVDGPGGPIETWLVSPAGAGDKPLPLVVDIHGGPLGAWTPAPPLEAQMLASAGYRVALPNIRGSASYGGSWVRPHMGHWGEVDAADVVAVVDRLVGDGLADQQRVGLLGLSYGGFLVNWLVGAEPGRFAAAVSENGVTNQVASWALSDTGPDYNRRSALGEPFTAEGIEALWRQSPLRLAPAIATPLLLLQGETDMRCPAADNEQLFLVLRAFGRPVEYILYPDSSHLYAIVGRPDRRRDRNRRMLDWFARYMG